MHTQACTLTHICMHAHTRTCTHLHDQYIQTRRSSKCHILHIAHSSWLMRKSIRNQGKQAGSSVWPSAPTLGATENAQANRGHGTLLVQWALAEVKIPASPASENSSLTDRSCRSLLPFRILFYAFERCLIRVGIKALPPLHQPYKC